MDRADQHFHARAAFALDQDAAMAARGLGGLSQRGAEIGLAPIMESKSSVAAIFP